MTTILELNDVSLTYHTVKSQTVAVEKLNFSVFEGEFVSIIGPSGCGKTTVLSLAAGLMKPSSGQVLFRGKPVKKAQNGLGYMLQKDHLFPWRTIEKNVFLPLDRFFLKLSTQYN